MNIFLKGCFAFYDIVKIFVNEFNKHSQNIKKKHLHN